MNDEEGDHAAQEQMADDIAEVVGDVLALASAGPTSLSADIVA